MDLICGIIRWKKYGCPRQRTENMYQKNSGQIEILMGMWAFFVVALVMLFCLKISHFMIAGAYVEDALAASNLASALIDIEEYGKSYDIYIKDPEEAFEVYKEALSVNLQLDAEGKTAQRALLEGPVRILSYIVYNVRDGQVEILSRSGPDGAWDAECGRAGEVFTPDGICVETTSVYSKVEFSVKGIGQQYITVQKEKSVDIKRNENE